MITEQSTRASLEDDEIMAPIRANREQLAAQFDYDPVRLLKYFAEVAAQRRQDNPAGTEKRPTAVSR
jgi:hypothetical protein